MTEVGAPAGLRSYRRCRRVISPNTPPAALRRSGSTAVRWRPRRTPPDRSNSVTQVTVGREPSSGGSGHGAERPDTPYPERGSGVTSQPVIGRLAGDPAKAPYPTRPAREPLPSNAIPPCRSPLRLCVPNTWKRTRPVVPPTVHEQAPSPLKLAEPSRATTASTSSCAEPARVPTNCPALD